MQKNCTDRLTLRPYEPSDAETIITWITDEHTLRSWSADKYDHFPISADDINAHYDALSAKCGDAHPLTAVDGDRIVGHLVIGPDKFDPCVTRFSYVIVDDKRRGTGIGGQMLSEAVRYALDELNAGRITLGVFENNPAAYRCYSSVGFRDLGEDKAHNIHLMGEDWKCLEMELTKEETMEKMLGYCGIDCRKCDVYIATVNNDDALRERTAKLWSELNRVTITPEMLNCTGCRADGPKTCYCSDMCGIRKCAEGKGYQTCGECADMEHCPTVAVIHKDNKQAKENLK